jgi:hypothetical protein
MLLTILTALGALLPSLLSKFGVSTTIDNLVGVAFSSGASITSAIQSKSATAVELAALQAALAAVEADTSIDPTVSADIAEGIRVLKAAITAYQAAEVTDDPTTLTPLPLVS